MKSWKTTTCGILTAIGAAISMIAIPLLDENPETAANWTGAAAAIMAAVGFLFARDNDKTSEDVKAK